MDRESGTTIHISCGCREISIGTIRHRLTTRHVTSHRYGRIATFSLLPFNSIVCLFVICLHISSSLLPRCRWTLPRSHAHRGRSKKKRMWLPMMRSERERDRGMQRSAEWSTQGPNEIQIQRKSYDYSAPKSRSLKEVEINEKQKQSTRTNRVHAVHWPLVGPATTMAHRLSRINLAACVSASSLFVLFVLSFFVRVVVVLAFFLIAACVRAFISLFIICELSLAPSGCLSFIRFVMVSAASRCRNASPGKRCTVETGRWGQRLRPCILCSRQGASLNKWTHTSWATIMRRSSKRETESCITETGIDNESERKYSIAKFSWIW